MKKWVDHCLDFVIHGSHPVYQSGGVEHYLDWVFTDNNELIQKILVQNVIY